MNVRQTGRRDGKGGTAGGHGLVAVWSLGLLCGLAAAAANEAVLLPLGLTLALAGGLPLLGLVLGRLLRPRRRAVVWEEASWHIP
jgi:hypothetical protein